MSFGIEVYGPTGQKWFSSQDNNLFFVQEIAVSAGQTPTFNLPSLTEQIVVFVSFPGVYSTSLDDFKIAWTPAVTITYAPGYPRVEVYYPPHRPDTTDKSGCVLTVFRTGKNI